MIVYDLRTQPLSIGDFVTYMEVGEIMGDRDIVYSYDPAKPTEGDPSLNHVNAQNFAEYFEPFKCLASQVFDRPVAGDWPTPDLSGYMFYHAYNEIFKEGVKPLNFKSADWAKNFLNALAARYCIHIRTSPRANNGQRNSSLEEWRKFFARSKERFVLIGEADKFRFDNTIIAKDYGTNIEQDLAIAAAADCYMGPASGPSSAVIFNSKPYRIFNMKLKPGRCTAYELNEGYGRFRWATNNQRCVATGPEMLSSIEGEFAAMTR